MNQFKKFTPIMFLMSISLLIFSFPLSAAENEQSGQTQVREHEKTHKEKEARKSGSDNGQEKRLSPDHHQSDHESYKENDLKVDHHDTRDHTDAMH